MNTPLLSLERNSMHMGRVTPEMRSVITKQRVARDRYVADASRCNCMGRGENDCVGGVWMNRHRRIIALIQKIYDSMSCNRRSDCNGSDDIIEAARALKMYGPLAKQAIPALIKVLQQYGNYRIVTTHPQVRANPARPMTVLVSVVQALGEMGPVAQSVKPLLGALYVRKHPYHPYVTDTTSSADLRAAIYVALRKINGFTHTRHSRNQSYARVKTVWYLRSVAWKVGYDKVVPILTHMARNDRDADVRRNATLALKHIAAERQNVRR